MKKYKLTPEHRAQLKPWAEKWIANAMCTWTMTHVERDICRESVKSLYRAANLEPPPDHRIVFVPSPFVARFAGGFAAWIWYLRGNKKGKSISAATDAATVAATRDATDAATVAATRDATYDATDAATYDATRDATYDATRNVWAINKWYFVNGGMGECANLLRVGKGGLECAQKATNMWQGGNQWSAWSSFLSFFRHVAKLNIDYSKWDAWEKLSIHSGPRVMHKEFCIISDRPSVLTVDSENRPHGENHAFCQWRDGSKLFSWHGIRVPGWVIERPQEITPSKIDAEENVEVRRVMIERFGFDRYMLESGAKVLDTMGEYQLISKPDPSEGQMVALKMVCPSTQAVYIHPVDSNCKTVNEALAWKRGDDKLDQKFLRHGDVYLISEQQKSKSTDYKSNVIWER